MRNNCFKRLTLQPLQIYPKKSTFPNELTIHNKNDCLHRHYGEKHEYLKLLVFNNIYANKMSFHIVCEYFIYLSI